MGLLEIDLMILNTDSAFNYKKVTYLIDIIRYVKLYLGVIGVACEGISGIHILTNFRRANRAGI